VAAVQSMSQGADSPLLSHVSAELMLTMPSPHAEVVQLVLQAADSPPASQD